MVSAFIITTLPLISQTTVADINGKEYKTVTIGRMVWMARYLNVNKFRKGDPIPHARTNEEWVAAGDAGKPS